MVWFVLAIVVVLGWLALFDLARIYGALEASRRELDDVEIRSIDDRGGLVAVVEPARRRLERAEDLARTSPWLAALAPVPLVGTQVGAVRDLAGAAADIGDLAAASAATIDDELEAGGGRPAARLDLIDAVVGELSSIRAGLEDIDLGAEGWLAAPLAGSRDRFAAEMAEADDDLQQGIELARTLRGLLAGPRDYLVLGANNAEMSGGGGMPLSAGVMHIEGAELEAGDFVPTSDLFLGFDEPVPVPPELVELYGGFGIGTEWRGTSASPNFPAVGPVFAAMSAEAGLGTVDGVLKVDAVTLRVLLDVVGPVVLDGVTYDAGNVEQQVLNEHYLRFDTVERATRTDLQSRLALATFDAVNQRPFSITDLASRLAEAARGRHLLAWSADPEEQALWAEIGADGSLNPGGLMINVENVAANKLDWYLDPKARLTVTEGPGGAGRVKLAVTIVNQPRVRTSPAIEGDGTGDLDPGDHRVFLALYLPEDAVNAAADPGFTAIGSDGPMKVVGLTYEIPQGATRRVDMEFALPPGDKTLTLLPSGRVRPIEVTFNGSPVDDAQPVELTW